MKYIILIFLLIILLFFIFYLNFASFEENLFEEKWNKLINLKYNIKMKYVVLVILFIIILLIFYFNYSKIPSFEDHVNRNKNNVLPLGKLTNIKDNKYLDENNIIWIKRGFMASLLHNPLKYYIFEEYNSKKQSSSEAEILKKNFDNGKQFFKPASFNYYSSINSPLSHFFADVLPIIIYLAPNYKIYD